MMHGIRPHLTSPWQGEEPDVLPQSGQIVHRFVNQPLLTKAAAYTHLGMTAQCCIGPPLSPQVWGETGTQSPPELGDLGGKIAGNS
jgi:hypothetical protein